MAAGPWDAYASPAQGPWTAYQSAPLGTDNPSLYSTALDVAKGAGTGLLHAASSAVSAVTGAPQDMLEGGVNKLTGGPYVPQGTAGQIAQGLAEYAPAMVGGEASTARTILPKVLSYAGRAAKNVVAPYLGAQLANQVVPDAADGLQHWLHVGAQVLGAGSGAGLANSVASGVGRALGSTFETIVNPNLKPQAAEAIQAGFKIPPLQAVQNPSTADVGLSGLGGRYKVNQLASEHNQDLATSIVAQDLGLPPGTQLTRPVLQGVRAKAGQAYAAIPREVPTVTADPRIAPSFQQAVANIGNVDKSVESVIPSVADNAKIKALQADLGNFVQQPTDSVIASVRQLRANATKAIRSPDPETAAYGLAQQKAADALDQLVQENLDAANVPELSTAYKQARQTIAKSYDAQLAANETTGEINPLVLGRLATRGRPLTGGMRTVATVANSFPKAMQNAAAQGGIEPLSVFDVGGAMIAPHAAPGILSRPFAQRTVLSAPYQKGMLRSQAPNYRLPAALIPASSYSLTPGSGLLGGGFASLSGP